MANNKSVEDILSTYTGLLTITNASDLGAARAAFTNGISRYMAASQFIRNNRPAGVRRLFNLDSSSFGDEQSFRTFLTDLESSLSAPFGGPGVNANLNTNTAFYKVISVFTNHTLSLSNFFSGQFSLRGVLPTLTTNKFTFIWDTFPDTTLGGVLGGLTQTNLGKAFIQAFHAQAQLNIPGVTCAVLSSGADNLQGPLNGVVQGNDGNFYGTVTYGAAYGYGGIFRAKPGGGFTLLYSFGNPANMNGQEDGAYPSGLTVGTNGLLYGTTQSGSDRGTGNIFEVNPSAATATPTPVYSFGDQDDGSISGGNPLLLAKDGNFYGTTPTGGDNSAGVIFKFTPPSSGAREGVFTVLGSFPAVTTLNFYARGAGAGALLQGRDGYFYGATQFGGDHGAGSLFQFIPGTTGPSGAQFHTGYSFPQLYDAAGTPITLTVNTPVLGANGIFYGTTQYGGENIQNSSVGAGDGSLFCIDTNGNFTNLYSFDEKNFDGFGPIGPMVQDATGAFYGLTSSGGANGSGTIFQFKPGAAPSFLVWFDDALGKQQNEQNGNGGYNTYNNGGMIPSGLMESASGLIYGTAPESGPVKGGDGTVFSFAFSSNSPASIVTSPASTTNLVGGNATLTVSAGGTGTLRYTWARVGMAMPANASGATTPNLTFTGLTTNDAGSYYVVVNNDYGSATSTVAVLTVLQGPAITTQPATPVSLVQGEALSLKVAASGAGLSYYWLANGNYLADGGFISGSGTSNLVISPAAAGNSGSYSVIVSNAVGSVTSKVSTVTIAVDKTAPTVAITSPAAGGGRSNAPVAFRGTASEILPLGNVLISSVNYWITNLNGAPLTAGQAVLTAGAGATAPSNWTALFSPPAGSNIFAVQSQDFSGNKSPVASLKFFLKSPVSLTLITNAGSGNGSVKGSSPVFPGDPVPANGAMLNVGEAYSVTATPGPNSFFAGWAGGATQPYAAAGTNATYSFIMQSNLVLQANFVTNIFVGMAGTYNGLFSSDALGIAEETAGLIGNLTLMPNGLYTATVKLAGSAPSISGTFTHDGFATNSLVPIALDGNVKVVLSVNANSAPRTISVSVTGTNLVEGLPGIGVLGALNASVEIPAPGMQWTSQGTLFASTGKAVTSLDAGRYTMLIPPAQSSTILTPTGYGYALLTNSPGTAAVPPSVTIMGVLADGTAISQVAPIGEDNGIPIFANPYNNNSSGLLFGRLNLSSSPAFPVLPPSGNLTWIRKASSSGLFKAGFTNTSLAVQGSPWLPFVPLNTVIQPNSQLVVSNGNFTVLLSTGVSVNKTNLVPAGTTPNYASGSINTNTGQLTITFTNGGVRCDRAGRHPARRLPRRRQLHHGVVRQPNQRRLHLAAAARNPDSVSRGHKAKRCFWQCRAGPRNARGRPLASEEAVALKERPDSVFTEEVTGWTTMTWPEKAQKAKSEGGTDFA